MTLKKHSERRAAGLDTLRTLGADTFDPGRAAGAMEKHHGALGSFGVDHILGQLWNRPTLCRRDRSLIVVAFLAASGASDEELRFHARGAVNHGLTREQVEEIVIQVAAYAGFPSAMAASRAVTAAWREADAADNAGDTSSTGQRRPVAARLDDDARQAAAHEVRQTMWAGRNNPDVKADRDALIEYLGGVGEFAFDFAFGEVWSRDVLTRRDRSLVTVAILGILKCTDELLIHVRAALNHGCTREELEEVMVQLSGYGGFPKAVEGLRAAREVFARIDARKQSSDSKA